MTYLNMTYLKFSLGIFLILAASRFVPHPPNFTSLLALSFYVPAFLGIRYLPALIIAFILTDFFIGFHSLLLFTWGSVLIIGYISKYFRSNIKLRLFGTLFGCIIFYLISNFGVWLSGSYGYSLIGLIDCYYMAIPFFGYTLLSTFLYSILIESLFKITNLNFSKI